uniref:Uncharacterized protein n=1 Tax=Ciona intestinalis TaxID=7719 RepID=H2XPV0_CIOIN
MMNIRIITGPQPDIACPASIKCSANDKHSPHDEIN